MGAFDILKGIVKSIAPVAANLVLPGSGSVVSGLINSVVPDENLDLDAKAQKVLDDPKLMADLKAKGIELEKTIAQEQTKNMADVNSTMRAELKDGRWYQRMWRPWNGFLFPVAVLGVYVAWPITRAFLMATHPHLALAGDINVPFTLWVTWGGVLGVAVYGRNKEKLADRGQEQPPGLIAGLMAKFMK